jgi:hypothetical protein
MKVRTMLGIWYLEDHGDGKVFVGLADYKELEGVVLKNTTQNITFLPMTDMNYVYTGMKEETKRDGKDITFYEFMPKPIFSIFGHPIIKRKPKSMEEIKAFLEGLKKDHP